MELWSVGSDGVDWCHIWLVIDCNGQYLNAVFRMQVHL